MKALFIEKHNLIELNPHLKIQEVNYNGFRLTIEYLNGKFSVIKAIDDMGYEEKLNISIVIFNQ